MKRGEFFAGVMKYHEQDSQAPDGIKLRDFLAHSFVGRSGSGPLPRDTESIVGGGLLTKAQAPTLARKTNRKDTHYLNPIRCQSRESLEPNCFSLLPGTAPPRLVRMP